MAVPDDALEARRRVKEQQKRVFRSVFRNTHFSDTMGEDGIEKAVEKGAAVVLMPVSARKQLFDFSDDMVTRINVQFYSETPDALLKALLE